MSVGEITGTPVAATTVTPVAAIAVGPGPVGAPQVSLRSERHSVWWMPMCSPLVGQK